QQGLSEVPILQGLPTLAVRGRLELVDNLARRSLATPDPRQPERRSAEACSCSITYRPVERELCRQVEFHGDSDFLPRPRRSSRHVPRQVQLNAVLDLVVEEQVQ